MPSVGVAPAFYEVEDGGAGMLAGVVCVSVEEFGFQGGEERLGDCVVVGVSFSAHGGNHPGLLAAVPERRGRILAAWVPLSEWWITPLGWRWEMAMSKASVTNTAAGSFLMDHPTTLRDHRSMTTARYKNPAWVGT